METVSVVIPTMKGREAMLRRLISTIPAEHEVIVVDDENLLLSAKRNKGAAKAKGTYILFIDDDNYLAPGAIENMVNSFVLGIGVMGMVACYSDKIYTVADGGSVRNYLNGFTRGEYTNEDIGDLPIFPYEVDEVANAFMVRRRLFDWIGGLDEVNFPIDLDEADLCKRVKDFGYKVMMCPTSICFHKSITYSHIPDFRRPMNAFFMARNRILYQKKHLTKLELWIYFLFFFPVFVASYCVSLLYRRKPWMCVHYLKGIWHGISGCRKNQYQQG